VVETLGAKSYSNSGVVQALTTRVSAAEIADSGSMARWRSRRNAGRDGSIVIVRPDRIRGDRQTLDGVSKLAAFLDQVMVTSGCRMVDQHASLDGSIGKIDAAPGSTCCSQADSVELVVSVAL
jgi:hypothetical protein